MLLCVTTAEQARGLTSPLMTSLLECEGAPGDVWLDLGPFGGSKFGTLPVGFFS